MPLVPDAEIIHERLAALPIKTFQAGEAVFHAGSRTDQLLFLRKGNRRSDQRRCRDSQGDAGSRRLR